MRALAVLLFAAAAAEELETKDLIKPVRIVQQAGCLVDSAEIVNDAVDAAMYMWASIARCGKADREVKCAVAISSTIQSVNGMVLVLVKSLDKCGDIHTENQACGIAAGEMTKRIAGTSARSASIVEKCTIKSQGDNFPLSEPIMCAVNVKDAAKNLMKLVKAILQNDRNCNEETKAEKPMRCADNALKIISAFAGIGQYLAGALGHCETQGNLAPGSECAQASIALVQQLDMVAEEGMELSRKCNRENIPPPEAPVSTVPPTGAELVKEDEAAEAAGEPLPERLFSKQGVFRQNAGSNTNVLLLAFLPVTAIVGFVGGRMYATRISAVDQAREFMSDAE